MSPGPSPGEEPDRQQPFAMSIRPVDPGGNHRAPVGRLKAPIPVSRSAAYRRSNTYWEYESVKTPDMLAR
jgi:hypothetical protein